MLAEILFELVSIIETFGDLGLAQDGRMLELGVDIVAKLDLLWSCSERIEC